MKPLESTIETVVSEYARLKGWAHRKIVYPGRRGCPDHFFGKGDRFKLVEFKRPRKELDEHQAREHKRLREEGGVKVYVIDNVADGCRLFD